MLIFMFVTIFFVFPETKGRSLEEMAEIFDGPEGVVVHDMDNVDDLKATAVEFEGTRDGQTSVKAFGGQTA